MVSRPDYSQAPRRRGWAFFAPISSHSASSVPSTSRTLVVLASLMAFELNWLVVITHASSVPWWILPTNAAYTDRAPTGEFHPLSCTATLRLAIASRRSTSWMLAGGVGRTV